MNKEFPTREQTIFLVCEDIRQEVGDKISLQGVFGGRTIQLDDSAAPLTAGSESIIPSLSFYICFHDGEGEYVSEFQIINPDGKNLLETHDTKRKMIIGNYGANYIFRITPFPIKIGKYEIVVLLDGQNYRETFNVISKGSGITK